MVGVLAPQSSALLGLVDVLAPVLATGCTAVVVAAEARPLPAIGLAEVLATSDVPAGVANMLTGRTAELAPWLAAHAEVQALDLAGAPAELAADLERAAAGTVKRVLPRPATEPDPTAATRPRPAAGVHRDQDRLAPGRALSGRGDPRPAPMATAGPRLPPWPVTSSRSSSRSPRVTSSRCGPRGGGRTARTGRPSSATTTRCSRSPRSPSSPRSCAPRPSTTSPTTRPGRWCRT